MKARHLAIILTLGLAVLACNLPQSAPTPDGIERIYEIATLTAAAGGATAAPLATSSPTPPPYEPTGKIAFTCQVFKRQSGDQVCIMNADGSGYRRLTEGDYTRHFYPSMAPDGQSVVYSTFREENVMEIYEVSLDGQVTQITDRLGVLTGPAISPDGRLVAFTRWTPTSPEAIWVINRDGSDPHEVTPSGWDATWSPDGSRILFASDRGGNAQLYTVKVDGSDLQPVTVSMPLLRGRTDWSVTGDWIVTYAGTPWQRELYLLRPDGSDIHQISPPGGNSQGPSFSPDGQWVAFTAYFDHYGDDHGCEIYIMRLDGTDLRRLTDNDYCDWQPRWGP